MTMRRLGAAFLFIVMAGPACADEAAAVEALKKREATIERDHSIAGEPVIRVRMPCGRTTAAALKELNELKQLRALSVRASFITDAGVKSLTEFGHLTELLLGYNSVTDAGLKELKKLPQLTRLDLSHNTISDQGLKELKECKRLRHLDLRSNNVTDTAVNELRRALPDCVIVGP
jgi:hypothetical protein